MAKSKFLLDERTGGMSAAMIDSDYPAGHGDLSVIPCQPFEREREYCANLTEKMAAASNIESSHPG